MYNVPSQAGRRIIVTGSNSGTGKEAAKRLAGAGAHVVLAVRTIGKGEAARDEILTAHPGASVEVRALDLADLASVRAFADGIDHVDTLVNNAGVMVPPTRMTTVITAIKQAHPDKTVFADLKTMDAGELEANIAFNAGADLVTVLGSAGDSTIIGAVTVPRSTARASSSTSSASRTSRPGRRRSSHSAHSSSRCTPDSTSRPRRASPSRTSCAMARPPVCRFRWPAE